MSFYNKLKKIHIPAKKLKYLPHGYFIIGDILLIKLKPEVYGYRKIIAKEILNILPYIRTVCLQRQIKGKTRRPKIEVLVGNRTKTVHMEHGKKFAIDVSKLMWSKGNKTERIRLIKQVKSGETIVDMFAGIGYFSVFLAEKCKKIYAIEINPVACRYLHKNLQLNKIKNVKVLRGDCRKFPKLQAHRIIMGYLYETEKFLPFALKIVRKKGIIHLHRIARVNELEKIKRKILSIGKKYKFNIKVLKIKKVKSYSPKTWHWVFDLRVKGL